MLHCAVRADLQRHGRTLAEDGNTHYFSVILPHPSNPDIKLLMAHKTWGASCMSMSMNMSRPHASLKPNAMER